MDGRVDVAEVPFVRGDLAVGVQIEAAQEQLQLALGEADVDHGQGDGVEGEVPGREPRVLPGVRHRHDLVVDHVVPGAVADAGVGGERVDAVLGQPSLDVEVVVLLAPQHPGQRLPHQAALVLAHAVRDDVLVEGVGLGPPRLHRGGELGPGVGEFGVGQPQPQGRAAAGGDRHHVMDGGLGAGPRGVDGRALAVDDVPVDAVLDVRRVVRAAEDALVVRLVLGEQDGGVGVDVQPARAEFLVIGADGVLGLVQARYGGGAGPGPGVPEPEGRQQVEGGFVGAPVVRGDLDQHVLGAVFGVFDEDVEVAVLVEDAGVEQLVLEFAAAAGPVGVDEVGVGELALRVLVQVLHVRVGGCAVEVEVVLLDVLAVVALGVGQAEHPFLEDGVPAVPQGEREAQPLLVVAYAGDAVLAPPIGAGAGLVMGEVRPGVTVGAVVLPDGPPLAFAEVGAPPAPGRAGRVGLLEPLPFGTRRTAVRHHRRLPGPGPAGPALLPDSGVPGTPAMGGRRRDGFPVRRMLGRPDVRHGRTAATGPSAAGVEAQTAGAGNSMQLLVAWASRRSVGSRSLASARAVRRPLLRTLPTARTLPVSAVIGRRNFTVRSSEV